MLNDLEDIVNLQASLDTTLLFTDFLVMKVVKTIIEIMDKCIDDVVPPVYDTLSCLITE